MTRDATTPSAPTTAPKSDDWTTEELTAAVEAYERMMAWERLGIAFTKQEVYRDLAARFPRTAKAFEFRLQNISAIRQNLGLPMIPGLRPADHIGAHKRPALEAIVRDAAANAAKQRNYKYGPLPTWGLALGGVVAQGGQATTAQVREWIVAGQPSYNTENLLADLYRLSVNSPSRTGYSSNGKPRRTDSGNPFDCLFHTRDNGAVKFELYDPKLHGVWEIYHDTEARNRHKMAIRQLSLPPEPLINENEDAPNYDPTATTDTRHRVLAMQVRRRGQYLFRSALFSAYQANCAISECAVEQALEAAHIAAYSGEESNVASNGLLLRVDIHRLFDLGLIWIDPDTSRVVVSEQLAFSEYWEFNGRPLRPPSSPTFAPSRLALEWHITNRVNP